MTAWVIAYSAGSFITLEQATFALCDTGMNVIFIYFLSHSNHLVSFANSFFWIITFLQRTQSGGKSQRITHDKTFL